MFKIRLHTTAIFSVSNLFKQKINDVYTQKVDLHEKDIEYRHCKVKFRNIQCRGRKYKGRIHRKFLESNKSHEKI